MPPAAPIWSHSMKSPQVAVPGDSWHGSPGLAPGVLAMQPKSGVGLLSVGQHVCPAEHCHGLSLHCPDDDDDFVEHATSTVHAKHKPPATNGPMSASVEFARRAFFFIRASGIKEVVST